MKLWLFVLQKLKTFCMSQKKMSGKKTLLLLLYWDNKGLVFQNLYKSAKIYALSTKKVFPSGKKKRKMIQNWSRQQMENELNRKWYLFRFFSFKIKERRPSIRCKSKGEKKNATDIRFSFYFTTECVTYIMETECFLPSVLNLINTSFWHCTGYLIQFENKRIHPMCFIY